MQVNWSALGMVALVSLLGAVTLIALFSLGVRSLGLREAAGERGESGALPLAGAVASFGLFAVLAVAGVLLIAFPSLMG